MMSRQLLDGGGMLSRHAQQNISGALKIEERIHAGYGHVAVSE